jgi:phosphoribosylformylglycinamidine synthase
MRNAGLKYICKYVNLRVENIETPFTNACKQGEVLRIPIGHMEGNYYCDAPTLEQLKKQNRIIFRYSEEDGRITPEANPNGSLDNIAGICNEGRNVLGMMPHPDRSSESLLGSADGAKIFKSMALALVGAR